MPEFKITPEVSWGSIMSTLTIVVGLAVGWTIMDERSKQTAASVAEFKAQLSAMDARFREVEAASPQAMQVERTVQALETRMRAAETAGARSDERMSNILSLLARIDARLERIERGETRP